MAYMSHGRADAESLLDFMDSRRRLMSEILTIFLGQPTLADVRDSYYFLGSADIGWKQRRMLDISLYIRIRRLLQYFGDDE